MHNDALAIVDGGSFDPEAAVQRLAAVDAMLGSKFAPLFAQVLSRPAGQNAPRNHAIVPIAMTLTIELEQEADGRWIAEIPQLPGVLVYADSPERAAQMVRALAFRVLAEPDRSGRG